MSGKRPVIDGLFEIDGDAAHLIGTRCRSCDARYFPLTPSCRNPDCREKRVERVSLPDRGTLQSFTIQRYAPPPAFRIDDWSPYAIGLVDLGDGLLVMGMMTDVELDRVRIGMVVRVVARPLFIEDEQAVVTYMFAPEGGEG